jgi:large subunit ribosomal protein L17
MRHQRAVKKLGRTSSHRKAMLRNMVASFFQWEKIETTTIKAKVLRSLAEKLITLGKRGDLHARRLVLRLIPSKGVVHKLFTEIAPRFKERAGGYTRVVKTGFRPGDSAPMSVVEILREESAAEKKKKKKRKEAGKARAEGKKAPAGDRLPKKDKTAQSQSAGKKLDVATTSASEEGVKAEAGVVKKEEKEPETTTAGEKAEQ